MRERLADIVELAEHFLSLFGTPARRLSAEAAARLLAYRWPGNVRELRNAMERVAVLGRRVVISAEDLDFIAASPPALPVPTDLPGAVAQLEQTMIRGALAAAGGNRSEAARRLGIHRQLLHEKLRRYGIELSGNQTDTVGSSDV